jgi:uncharacterized protein DUF4145
VSEQKGVPYPAQYPTTMSRPLLVGDMLELSRCPHCRVDYPNLQIVGDHVTHSYSRAEKYWRVYVCRRCGGLVSAESAGQGGSLLEYFPKVIAVDPTIPAPASAYLQQAMDTIHAPAGAVMLAASAVDAMLKKHGFTEGSLFSRIDQARDQHLITPGMALWAHDVRLEANDQRHADQAAELPTEEDAQRAVDFALALAQFLFVLPARVERGLSNQSHPPAQR